MYGTLLADPERSIGLEASTDGEPSVVGIFPAKLPLVLSDEDGYKSTPFEDASSLQSSHEKEKCHSCIINSINMGSDN